MNNYRAFGFATLTVILNGLVGHFFAPSGILLTPIILTITTSLICFKTKNIKAIFISILTFSFVALNDFSIKLYAGGRHDSEGQGFITLLLFIGLVPTFGILIPSILKLKNENPFSKIVAIILFFSLIAIHLKIFGSLGLGRYC